MDGGFVDDKQRREARPPIIEAVAGKSVEQEALEIVMNKKKVNEQRDQLRQLIQYTCKVWHLGRTCAYGS